MNPAFQKMIFPLIQDEDGYPPVSTEGMWVSPTGAGLFRIENIPFYVCDISFGDIVAGIVLGDGRLAFEALYESAGHSTFRVILHDEGALDSFRRSLDLLGTVTEVNRQQQMIAVDVPGNVAIQPVLQLLMRSKQIGDADFEEAALRHAV